MFLVRGIDKYLINSILKYMIDEWKLYSNGKLFEGKVEGPKEWKIEPSQDSQAEQAICQS